MFGPCSRCERHEAQSPTPFARHGVTLIKLSRETPRHRRLNADIDEEGRLLAACDTHLRALVEAALATGMRQGELVNLRWRDVQGMTVDDHQRISWAPRAAIVLDAAKTKTKRSRVIPISSRLKAIVELRRFDPAGDPLSLDAYVFGNRIGQRIESPKRAWTRAVLVTHGITPTLTNTANFDAPTRAAFKTVNLHFHDLRREAGFRWLEGGVPLHTVRDWLGHTSIAQTSTYLAGTALTQFDAMEKFDQVVCNPLATEAGTGRQTGARTATGHDTKLNKTAEQREPTIM